MTERDIARLGGIGILTPADIEDFKASERRVFEFMQDGKWHSPEQIELAAGVDGRPARGGTRRMRQLRAYGYTIERVKMGKRGWWYRLGPRHTDPTQPELF